MSDPASNHFVPQLLPSSPSIPSPAIPICEFGPRLGFTFFRNPIPDPNHLNNLLPANSPLYWFTIDNLLVYLSFYQDTGPLNCACLYRFCLHLHGLLEDQSLADRRIVMYSSADPDKKANAALLMALYCMIVLRWSPADALHPISQLEIQPFRDAGYARADFNLSIQNVLFGVRKAIELRLLRLDEFDLKEYEMFEKVEHGDYNWLSPHFIAFASPVEAGHGRVGKAFRLVLDQFERVGVRLVIRLNKKLYDENRFIERGIAHREMYFDDGTNPTMEMVKDFISISDRIIDEGGVVAVHCKAGLGRTGTLIGAYLIYKYGFTADEAIGFMRIMRPGTCVGPQQHFLYENQLTWVKWAARDELLSEQQAQISPSKTERPITPPPDHDAGRAPATPPPRTQSTASKSAVPGQPRKTPGAKTRHMVSAPEGRPTGAQLMEQEEAQEQLTEDERPAAGSPVKAPLRPRPRPASALSDHRPSASSGLVRRSKAVKDLGTLFEGPSAKDGKSGGTRYNLRGARVVSGVESPSRLPQRVVGVKKRGCGGPTTATTMPGGGGVVKGSDGMQCVRVTEVRGCKLGGGGGSSSSSAARMATAGGGGSGMGGGVSGVERCVRRRRSSLGTTDLLV